MRAFIYRDLPADAGDFRLVSRRCLDSLKAMRETHRFIRGMVAWVGFAQTAVVYHRAPRAAGESKYPLRKMIKFAWTAAVSFSTVPLRLGLALGFIVASMGLAFGTYVILGRLFNWFTPQPGWASLVVLISLVGGAVLISNGILGEYIGRIFEEGKGRPLYIVSSVFNADNADADDDASVSASAPAVPIEPQLTVYVQGNTRRSKLDAEALVSGDIPVKSEQDIAQLHDREADFHDEWARAVPLEQIAVREAFEAPTAMENKFILKKMGNIRGLKLLDIGAGLGESSVYFALQGAQVTATDLSPGMVETAVNLAKFHNTSIEGVVSPGETLNVPDNHYDLVYIANTIHHVGDRAGLYGQIRQKLKPGGRFFSIDPVAYNPVINVYRRMATEVRTPDEAPLTVADLTMVKQYFNNVGHREFWVSTLALFIKYYMGDRVHPNADRYWKRILKESPKSLWWWHPLAAMDVVLTRLPLVKWLAWNIVMWGEKPA